MTPPIIMYGLCRWDYIVNRPQNLAREFARHTEVVYLSPTYAGDARAEGALMKHVAGPAAAVRQIAPHLSEVALRYRLPFGGRFAAVESLNEAMARSALREVVARLEEPPILWVMHPSGAWVAEAIEHSALVYDLVDRHADFPGQPPRVIDGIRAGEEYLFANADLVTATARELMTYARQHGARRVELVPNGCDYGHFAAVTREPRGRLDEPTVAYAGAIGEWFDFAALRSLAAGIPEARVRLAGPFHHPVAQLPDDLPPNVEHIGVLGFDELPGFFAESDLGVVPFAVDEMTAAVNPVKVYEYLAAGLPVLSTALPEVVAIGDVVSVADAPDWAGTARALLASDSRERVERRRAFARANSWSERAKCAMRVIEEALGSTDD